ncbi:MAG: cobalamin biosynthesis protein CbiX [Nitrosospira sp.]|nr:cobalamin biosynthesis protein CbiX [Nitrosospira sp.]
MKIQCGISRWFYLSLVAALTLVFAGPSPAIGAEPQQDVKTGFVILASDRGFAGNEDIIDAFDIFGREHNASLVFVTDERTRKYLRAGIDTVVGRGAVRIVVIPLFISAANPRFALVRRLLEEERGGVPVSYARPYGETFFAVEDLADKFRVIKNPADSRIVVAGFGATNTDNEREIRADLDRIAEKAAAGFGFASITVVIAHDIRGDEGEIRAAEFKRELIAAVADTDSNSDPNAKVVPFHFGPKFDSMMSFDARLKRLLPAQVELIQASGAADPVVENLATWLKHVANRNQQLARKDIGVVLLSHGSDFNWNESIREAVQPLMKDYKIEFAFSMADPATIERAIRKLEHRGARAAVIVRVFALEESFRDAVERMTGLDIEGEGAESRALNHVATRGNSGHGHGHGHSNESAAVPAPRIRTALPVETVGGLGSSPLFAAALLDRSLALSRNPQCDTVVLVAHGSGDDRQNAQWQTALEAIAEHMRDAGGAKFAAIRVATWREDWRDKRAPWIEKVREMVEDATKHGGRAIVIPARTTGEGPERRFLSGLEYDLGSGFAPHPKFVQWMKEQIETGAAQFKRSHATGIVPVEAEEYTSYPETGLWW